MKKYIVFVLIFIIVAPSMAQSQGTGLSGTNKNNKYNEIAQFIAGLPIDSNSALYNFTRLSEYRAYKQTIDWMWSRFDKHKLQQIAAWQSTHLASKQTSVVFYPFSGPDISNALMFFPHADEYVMIGLESPGEIPNPYGLNQQRLVYRLWHVKKALRTLLTINFFRTSEMWTDIKINSFSSITGILMFFLTKSGHEIIEIKKISVNKHGKIVEAPSPLPQSVRGVEIVFKKYNANHIQRLRYFKVDISDKPLKQKFEFIRFLGGYKDFTSFTKAASYLLSYDNFKIVRNYMLTRSKYIVQSDCGIPFRYYDQKKWHTVLYGKYVVLKMFIKLGRYQKDYALAMKRFSKGRLPFSFGYGYSPDRSNLLFVERTESNPKK